MNSRVFDFFGMTLLAMPLYLALSARSFEYKVIKLKANENDIKQFLDRLNYPSRIFFTTDRWNLHRINYKVYFSKMSANYLFIQRWTYLLLISVLFLAVVIATLWEAFNNVFYLGLLFIILHSYLLFVSWRFGSKLLTIRNS